MKTSHPNYVYNRGYTTENKLTWLDFGVLPVRYHVEGKRLPDFIVFGDPGSQEPIALSFHGQPDVIGTTTANLAPDLNGGPSKVLTFDFLFSLLFFWDYCSVFSWGL